MTEAERSEIALSAATPWIVGSAKFPPSVFFFPFQFCRDERDKQKRCDEVGRLDISSAGRTA